MKQKQRYKTHKHKSYYKEGNGLARQNLLYTTGVNVGMNDLEQSDAKRHNKKNCVYYDKNSAKCVNIKCHVNICVTASGCTVYRQRSE